MPPAGRLRLGGRAHKPFRSEEEETDNGPADYALWLGDKIAGVVEAKKVTLGPQNVLTQAQRVREGLRHPGFNFDGLRCPFLSRRTGK